MKSSSIQIENIHFKSLENNPLGDPVVRSVPVYLPGGYAQSDRRYPVVFLLSGFAGRGTKMLNDDLWEETIQQRADRLIQAGSIKPMILVLPDASTRYGGSQYINSSATGNYEDHLLELVTHIDTHFRTIPSPKARGIAGKSSGGYGATIMGMRHPNVFGLIADHSGDKYFELCYKPDFIKLLRFYGRSGMEGLRQAINDPASVRPKPGDFFSALNICAMASCYAPNSSAELGFDLPIDLETGELQADIWAKWEANDPINLITQYAENLKSLSLLFFDCGARDEYNLQYGARIFAKRLTEQKIPFTQDEFDDGHRGLNYRYDRSLSLFSKLFSDFTG